MINNLIKLFKRPKKAVSAGGVVVKKIKNIPHILLIRDKRYNDWILPKGHVESNETLEETALREVLEEAHLNDVKLIKLLGTYKRFVPRANENKTIHYFLMKAGNDTKITEEYSFDTEEVKWHPIDNLPSFYIKEQEDVIIKNKSIIKSLA